MLSKKISLPNLKMCYNKYIERHNGNLNVTVKELKKN